MRACYTVLFVVAVAALGFCTGCYDGEMMVRDARSTALNTRMAEIDLGRFRTTMPRDRKNNSFTELEIHLFATVLRSRVTAVKQQISAEEYRLRHDLLAAVRGATSDELTEPSLAQLRDRLKQVVNAVVADHPVKSVGFYSVKLRRR